MVKGFNSDLTIEGLKYHVQTEDWGHENPFLVSQVYYNGAIVKRVKSHYTQVLPKGLHSGEKSIKTAMQYQHNKILDLLLSGQLL